MDGLMKVWQVWNRTKIIRVECYTHKNVRANRVETVQKNNEKTKSNECSKSSVVVAPCLLTTGQNEFWAEIVDF
jgi:hypothetical protein